MKPGMEIITSDGRHIGHLGPIPSGNVIHLARTDKTFPLFWIAQIDRQIVLRKTYAQIVEYWGAEPGPRVIRGGKSA